MSLVTRIIATIRKNTRKIATILTQREDDPPPNKEKKSRQEDLLMTTPTHVPIDTIY